MLCLFLKQANFYIIHDIKSILQGTQRKKISNGEKKKEKKKVTTLQQSNIPVYLSCLNKPK